MNVKQYLNFLLFFSSLISQVFSEEMTQAAPIQYIDEGVGVSSNPSPADHIGSGYLGDTLFHIGGSQGRETGLSLETLWILDGNQILSGHNSHQDRTTFNNLLQFELLFDTGKVSNWKGGLFAIEYLQLNGAQTNAHAHLIQGFEGLIQTSPLTRGELYTWWYRQEFFDKKLITRIGKSTPNFDFNAVNRLFPMNEKRVSPVASGVIYGTIFNQGSLAAFLPSYYNSAFGASAFYFPTKSFYTSVAGYDGNKARGKQTGLEGPHFNGYYFLISESGYSWSDAELPGRIAIGVWKQTGKLELDTGTEVIAQKGVCGIYMFGSQRLWWKDKECANSGVVAYFQLGLNNSKTLSINRFFGCGITAYGLVPGRLKDSFGLGLSLAGLNKNSAPRSNEWMFQTYYQCNFHRYFYLEPVISYIPKPGAIKDSPAVWAATLRVFAYL